MRKILKKCKQCKKKTIKKQKKLVKKYKNCITNILFLVSAQLVSSRREQCIQYFVQMSGQRIAGNGSQVGQCHRVYGWGGQLEKVFTSTIIIFIVCYRKVYSII